MNKLLYVVNLFNFCENMQHIAFYVNNFSYSSCSYAVLTLCKKLPCLKELSFFYLKCAWQYYVFSRIFLTFNSICNDSGLIYLYLNIDFKFFLRRDLQTYFILGFIYLATSFMKKKNVLSLIRRYIVLY